MTPAGWRTVAGKIYATHGYPPELAKVISRGEITARKVVAAMVKRDVLKTGR